MWGFIARDAVTKSAHLIDTWKVLVPQAFNGGDSVPHQILGKPLISPSPSVCTQSFLFFNVRSEDEGQERTVVLHDEALSFPCLTAKNKLNTRHIPLTRGFRYRLGIKLGQMRRCAQSTVSRRRNKRLLNLRSK